MTAQSKVACIGWAKTGTTSLGEALKILGYKHKGQDFDIVEDLMGGSEDSFLQALADYDSFDDWPWLLYFERILGLYPDTKFILTVRDVEPWIVSYRKQLDRAPDTEMAHQRRAFLYGFDVRNASDEQLCDRYLAHNAAVAETFADKPGQLLTIDLTKNSEWGTLCEFLGRPQPAEDFPHANKAPPKRSLLQRALARLGG